VVTLVEPPASMAMFFSSSTASLLVRLEPAIGCRVGTWQFYPLRRRSRDHAYERGGILAATLRGFGNRRCGGFSLTIGAVQGRHTGIARERSYRIEVPLSVAQPRDIALNGRDLNRSDDEPPPGHWHRSADRVVVEVPVVEGRNELTFR
jgi:hypothetical protein